MSAADYEYDVFLSHNSADRATVEALALRLRDAELSVWLDSWSLIPGEPWQEALEGGLRRSRTVVIAIGPEGIGPWQNEEMRTAIDARTRDPERRVIPLLLPGASSDLPAFLKRLTWVDFRAGLDDDEAFKRLLAGIKGEALDSGRAKDAAQAASPNMPATDATYRATLTGSGAIAQGPGGVAAGKGGIAMGGDVKGSVTITPDEDDAIDSDKEEEQ